MSESDHDAQARELASPDSIRVELFGLARQRAGKSCLTLDVAADGIQLGVFWQQLRSECPTLIPEQLTIDEIRQLYLVNLNGERFIQDAEAMIPGGANVLVLSADAGG